MLTKICQLSFLGLFILFISCKKKDNNDDTASALALLINTGSSPTCTSETSGLTLTFLNNIPTTTQARINYSEILSNKYAGIQTRGLTTGRRVAFRNTGNIIASVNRTSDCRIVNGTTAVASPVTDYTLNTSGSNYTYTIINPGDYIFILQTPSSTDTSSHTVGLE
ncbi:MAG: hypothetical protein MH321_16335 [Leptospiraceae bacterium]|nr:hypothetical protein [Leptospiraceae bacterium]